MLQEYARLKTGLEFRQRLHEVRGDLSPRSRPLGMVRMILNSPCDASSLSSVDPFSTRATR